MAMQAGLGNRTCHPVRQRVCGGHLRTLSAHNRRARNVNENALSPQNRESQGSSSDDSLNWEDFFGSAVDISSSLLNVYDCLVRKSEDENVEDKNEENISSEVISTDVCQPLCSGVHNPNSLAGSRTRSQPRFPNNLSVNDTCTKRPVSTSSVSSSSSSSSSSFLRNGMDVKRFYMASNESLADNGPDEDNVLSRDRLSHHTRISEQKTLGLRGSKHGTADFGNRINQKGVALCRQVTYDPSLCPTDRVIMEIVDTERTYVNDLQEIINGYFQYMLSLKPRNIGDKTLEDLSGNIEDIYEFNKNFLKELEDCGLRPVEIARCFVRNSTGFAIYAQYCTNYPRSIEVLTKLMQNLETADIFRERQLSLHHQLPLGSYLLKPVQRITKYQLLLNNLVKHMDKDGNGYPVIKNAISVMTGLVYHINDMKRKHEDAIRVQEIQSLLYEWQGQDLTTYGELVAEGMFRMLGAKASRHLFLFDKMLLIVKKKEEGKLSYKGHITCSNLMLIESIQGEPLCFHVIPFNNPRLQYTFQAHNLKQKREWCLELKRVILENYNAVIPSKARQLVMELGQNKEAGYGSSDKSNSKRHLSAPEYLEKRKQERRKSEISLNKTFKLKKGNKKNDIMLGPKGSPAEKPRGRKFRSASHDATAFLSIPSHREERRASFDSAFSPSQRTMSCFKNANTSTVTTNNKSKCLLPSPISTQNESTAIDMDDESSLSDIPKTSENNKNEKSHWFAGNSVPDKTTDTEIEDNYDKTCINHVFQHCPPLRAVRTEKEVLEDLAGEYVTFVFAHQYACQDLSKSNEVRSSQFSMHPSYRSSTVTQLNQLGTSNEYRIKPVSKSALSSLGNIKKEGSFNFCTNKDGDYDNLNNLWYNLETTPVQTTNSGEICSTSEASLWKQNTVIQRVHSYTSINKFKVPSGSLHHSHSFQQRSTNSPNLPHKPKTMLQAQTHSKDYEDLTLFSVPHAPASDLRETAEAMHLRQLSNYLSSNCGSLPQSSHCSWNHNVESEPCKAFDYHDIAKGKMRVKTNCNLYGVHSTFLSTPKRSFPEDFTDDLDRYIASASHPKQQHFRLSLNSRDLLATCAATPPSSIENMSFHPEHRVYRQVSSRYATLKAVISSISSKISFLKVNLGYSVTDQSDNESMMSHIGDSPKSVQLEYHSSTRSDQEVDHKMSKTHLGNSFVRVSSTTNKQHLGKVEETRETKSILNNFTTKKNSVVIHKPGSSVIGARIAGLHEAEYCIPSSLFVCHKLRSNKEVEVRPDSLLSNSSNITLSSDGDKFCGGSDFHSALEPWEPLSGNITCKGVNARETLSDNSEDSEDSFYERSFEAIEDAVSEDLFRDSAIYSDPDNADLSTEEFSSITKQEDFLVPCELKKNYKTKNHMEDNKKISSNEDLHCLDKLTCDNNIQNCEKINSKTNVYHPEQMVKNIKDVKIKKYSKVSELTLEKVNNIVPRPIEVLSTRPVSVAIIQKFKNKNMRENNTFQNELTLSSVDDISIEKKNKENESIQKTFIPVFKTQKDFDSSLMESLKTVGQKQQENLKNEKEPSLLLVERSVTNQQNDRKNTVIQKECSHSLVYGLKSIQQSWCTQKSNQYIKEDESRLELSNPCLHTESVIEEVTSSFNSVEPFDTQSLPVKGWVKHIVSKFQNEN